MIAALSDGFTSQSSAGSHQIHQPSELMYWISLVMPTSILILNVGNVLTEPLTYSWYAVISFFQRAFSSSCMFLIYFTTKTYAFLFSNLYLPLLYLAMVA
jgi:hypothetical protein